MMFISPLNIYFTLLTFSICGFTSSFGYYFEISKPQQNSDSICSNECVKKVALTSNNVGTVKSCARGCRFFEIAQLIYQCNSTRLGCLGYCEESYKEFKLDLLSCKTGCEVARPKLPMDSPLIAEISWSIFVENVGDMSEQDGAMIPPPFKDQFINFEDFKMPDVKVRNVPIKHADGKFWIGLPHLFVASLLLLLVILALLLVILLKESTDAMKKDDPSLEQAPPLPEKLPIA